MIVGKDCFWTQPKELVPKKSIIQQNYVTQILDEING